MLEYKKFNHDGSLEFDCPAAGDYESVLMETAPETESTKTVTVPIFSSNVYGETDQLNGLLQLMDVAYTDEETNALVSAGYSMVATTSENEWISRGFYDLDVTLNNDQFNVVLKSTYLHGARGFITLPVKCTYCLYVLDSESKAVGKYVFTISVKSKN